jgi:hypothetical protein
MLHFYDAQIRRYITQTIRVLSNFTVKYSDGTLVRIPVLYGDSDRQAASIIRQNSENKINSVPRISVYISGLSLDASRLSDSTYIGKMHIRERGVDSTTGEYTNEQGRNYTIEKIMPTPYKLKLKVDIWTANTDQKLQVMEQLLILFNPTLELQTTDNYIDWTSLTSLILEDIMWSSKSVPVGVENPIDIGTLTLDVPIWISPPAKVKHLGVITKIITSMYDGTYTNPTGYVDGLGIDTAEPTTSMDAELTRIVTTITEFNIEVFNNQVILLSPSEAVVAGPTRLDMPVRLGTPINWEEVFSKYPHQYVAGSSRLFLTQTNGTEIVGTVAVDSYDNTILRVNWDEDTLNTNTGIDSNGLFDYEPGYDAAGSNRPGSPGTFDAIINPLTFNPRRPLKEYTDQPVSTGIRYLIVEDIGNIVNDDGPDAWKSSSGVDFIANANDIIEWDGNQWNVIFDSVQKTNVMVWQTNIYTGIQYLWNGTMWIKSFEGIYKVGQWKLEL